MGLLIGVGTTTPKFPYTDLWYGLRVHLDKSGHSVSDGKLERVGNLDLHRSLPIQSRIKRYVANADGSVNYWLGANDSRKKEGGGTANLNAVDGIVQLYKPDYWRRFEFDGNDLLVAISEVELPGFTHMSEKSRSPWLATFNRSTNVPTCACFLTWDGDLPARNEDGTLIFTDNAATYRGGTNNTSYDGTYRSLLGMPASSTAKSTIRTRCKSLGAKWHHGGWRFREEMSWLMAIEFGDLDSQASYNAEKTADGYSQGGLGNGTYYDWGTWGTYNGNNPFLPAGITAPLGNNTGIVSYQSLQSDGTYKTFKVASYRGWEQPQQYLWEHNDDIVLCEHKKDSDDGACIAYLCSDSSKFTTPADHATAAPDGYEELGALPTTSGFITAMGVALGYSFPNDVTGGAGNKNYCDYFWHPSESTESDTNDGFYQLLSAAVAHSAELSGVRCALALYRGALTHAYYGFPLCLDLSEEGI
jgi:hypothetical protein